MGTHFTANTNIVQQCHYANILTDYTIIVMRGKPMNFTETSMLIDFEHQVRTKYNIYLDISLHIYENQTIKTTYQNLYLQRTACGIVKRHLSAVSAAQGFFISCDHTLSFTVQGNSAAAAAASDVASSD